MVCMDDFYELHFRSLEIKNYSTIGNRHTQTRPFSFARYAEISTIRP